MPYLLLNHHILFYQGEYSGNQLLEIMEQALQEDRNQFYRILQNKGINRARAFVAPRFEHRFEFKDNNFKKIG